MGDKLNDGSIIGNTSCKEALPVFEKMVYYCSNDVRFKDMMNVMRVQYIKNQCEKGINSGSNYTKIGQGASLFGENNTNQISVKRHKFSYERYGYV